MFRFLWKGGMKEMGEEKCDSKTGQDRETISQVFFYSHEKFALINDYEQSKSPNST